MDANIVLEILHFAIARKGKAGFITEHNGIMAGDDENHPITKAFTRPDGLIEINTDIECTIIDPMFIIAGWCKLHKKDADGYTGQYA